MARGRTHIPGGLSLGCFHGPTFRHPRSSQSGSSQQLPNMDTSKPSSHLVPFISAPSQPPVTSCRKPVLSPHLIGSWRWRHQNVRDGGPWLSDSIAFAGSKSTLPSSGNMASAFFWDGPKSPFPNSRGRHRPKLASQSLTRKFPAVKSYCFTPGIRVQPLELPY